MVYGKYRYCILIVLVWLILTSLNISKAIHIDDAGHLEIAKHIIEDPLKPMSGHVNWEDSKESIHKLNQPHLFFYLLAAFIYFVSGNEIMMHAFVSLFALACAVLFFFLAARINKETSPYFLVLLCLGPAFIASQNIMVDIPMLSLWLSYLYLIFMDIENNKPIYLAGAAVMASCAILIKYYSMILLPVLVIYVAVQKQWQRLWVLVIPAAAILGWSLFNYYDYGGVHLLGREIRHITIASIKDNTINWFIGLGAIAPFTIIMIPRMLKNRAGWLILGLSIIASFIYYSKRIAFPNAMLGAIFMGNGVFALLCSMSMAWRVYRENKIEGAQYIIVVLLCLILSSMTFILLFAPFMAVRHILPVVPAILLIMALYLGNIGKKFITVITILTMFMGVSLAISDWQYADVYRSYAKNIAGNIGTRADVWYAGHWGWQWYARKEGMKEYDAKSTTFVMNDYLVVPSAIHKQSIRDDHRDTLIHVSTIRVESGLSTRIRTMMIEPNGGYYYYSYTKGSMPWTITDSPLEEFKIYRIGEKDKTGEDRGQISDL